MAVLAKTTGKFLVLDSITGEHIKPNRPGIFSRDRFVELQVSQKKIKILIQDLPDTVKDSDFEVVFKEFEGCDTQLESALENFKSLHLPEEDVETPPKKIPEEKETPYKEKKTKKKSKRKKKSSDK